MRVRIGYKASAGQFGPRELLDFSAAAEDRGLDMVAVSDHFQPWRHHGGHAPSALTWLGALGQATHRAALATSVLTPTLRYHPSVIVALSAERKTGIEDPLEMERVADANADRAHTRFTVSDDPADVVDRIGTYLDLGFTDLVLHGPGGDQHRFLEQFAADVLPGLRERAERGVPVPTGSPL